MNGRGIAYWGPALVVVGLMAAAVSFLVFRDQALYWAVAASVAVFLAGAVITAYQRIR